MVIDPPPPVAARRPHVVIVGGGITGLSTAWHLHTHAPDLAVTVLEAAAHWGGKVAGGHVPAPGGGRFIVDGGPDAFVTRKPELWDLAHELGLGDRLATPGNETRNMYILEAGRPVAVPLAPHKFLGSRILSLGGKLRLLAEPFIPARRDDGDESLWEYAARRLGSEAAERLVGPVLAGIYNADPRTQSVLSASPVMREMEKEAGGLFRGTLARGLAKARARRAGQNLPPAFVTFSAGTHEIVEALVSRLRGAAHLRLGAPVARLEAAAPGYFVILQDGARLVAEAVVLCTPANQAAHLLAGLAPAAARGLAAIRHSSIGTLTLAYRAADLRLPFPLQGLMIPRREGRAIDALTCPSAKLPTRAPAGYTLLRAFFGGGRPEMTALEEAELVTVVRRELHTLLGVAAEPVAWRAFRWTADFPLADVGHLDRVAAIEAQLPPGVHLAGNSYRGVGMPDCVRQGRAAAARVITQTRIWA
ncbi:MAG: protoporphyrinogen oxidase [Anaerolineales bacterium]|nr:protoporphyrinogen oxidase [Anaerolineales bacterium]